LKKVIILKIQQGWLKSTEHQVSPFFTTRIMPEIQTEKIRLLVIHNISLPAGEFGNDYITQLFLGKLDANSHESFSDIASLQVSAHCLIQRDGHIIQYVSFNDKAWHAGVSSFEGCHKCNDFSIGIELEGTDQLEYTSIQYQQLTKLTATLQRTYPLIKDNSIVGHCDIAPNRKTDPGESFNWAFFKKSLKDLKDNKIKNK